MTPTLEKIKEILANAPESATHYCARDAYNGKMGTYVKISDKGLYNWYGDGWYLEYRTDWFTPTNSLADLREILAKRDAEVARKAYADGFISACKWPEPVTQDIDSPAFQQELNEYADRVKRGE